jgi:UrcA family protein
MMKTLIPLTLLLAAASPAAAQPDPVSHASLHIGYSDLNLATQSGTKALDRRIARAIDTLCPEPLSRSLAEAVAVKTCRATAEASVARQREQALAGAKSGSTDIASGR